MQVILKNNKEILKDIEMFDNTFGMSPIKKNETLMGPVLSDGSVTQVPSTSQFPLLSASPPSSLAWGT